MKILIAPQAFKGSLGAFEVAKAIETGIKRIVPEAETVLLPMADGGDGTVEALVNATGGKFQQTSVLDPLGRATLATWGVLGDGQTAVIEMAAASGLWLVEPEKRDPLATTTYGTGQLIKAALDKGCRKLVIGLGGSATNDGGAGALQALGVRLSDARGTEISRGGGPLANLASIDETELDRRLQNVQVLIASDVTNPLVGPEGASHVYGPQKGATPRVAEQLDLALRHYGQAIRRHLGVDILDKPGAGAAGGLGGGLMAFLNAEMVPGAELVMQINGIEKHLDGADVVITGEGRIDGQTIYGKAPVALAKAAKRRNLPVIALVGGLGEGYQSVFEHGIDAAIPIVPGPMDLERAMAEAERLLENAAEGMMRLVRVGAVLGII